MGINKCKSMELTQTREQFAKLARSWEAREEKG